MAECLKSNTTITQVRLCLSVHASNKSRGEAPEKLRRTNKKKIRIVILIEVVIVISIIIVIVLVSVVVILLTVIIIDIVIGT